MLAATPTPSLTEAATEMTIRAGVPKAPSVSAPLFKTLTRGECESVLLRNNVGRLAFSIHDHVNIVPIHYAYLNGWIYGRTGSAGKLRDILRNRRIAFEVDEHSELFDWRSVVVHGPLYVVQPDTTQHARSIYLTALAVMRRLLPAALTESDPVPFRDQLIRIRAIELTGRASAPSGGYAFHPVGTDGISETADADQDSTLREKVEAAIASLGVPENGDVQIEAFDGIVVLSGTVETARDRHAIETEIVKIPAVTALVQELETALPLRQEEAPAELARAAIKALRRNGSTSAGRVKVIVEHGWLRIEGVVESQRQRDDALRRLRTVAGSRGLIDRTHIAKSV
jgi:uncharacterized protein